MAHALRDCTLTHTVTSQTLNPFRYSTPLDPEELVDRDAEAAMLLGLAEGGHNTRLSAPRGYGKTSLLRRVVADADARAGMNAAFVDLWGIATRADVALRLEDGYRALRGPIRRYVDRLLLDARVRANIGPAGLELSASRSQDIERLLLELLDVPKHAFEKTGKRTYVVFDEFQEVLRAGDGIDAVIRSRIQHQAREASYTFAGSHPGLLSELFDNRTRPLFGQARPIPLGPLADADLAAYIATHFENANRNAGRALDYLLRLAEGHPRRAMMLAHYLWEHTPPGSTANEGTWGLAQQAAYEELSEAYARLWNGLEDTDRRALTAVAAGRPLVAKETMERYEMTRGSAPRARERLLSVGEIQQIDGALRVTDPLLAAWLNAGRRTPSVVIEQTGGAGARTRAGEDDTSPAT